MRNVISISLPESMVKKLRVEVKKEHLSLSELMRKALNEHFFKTEFERLRRKALLEVVRRGKQLTDEDVFKRIS